MPCSLTSTLNLIIASCKYASNPCKTMSSRASPQDARKQVYSFVKALCQPYSQLKLKQSKLASTKHSSSQSSTDAQDAHAYEHKHDT